MDSHARGTPTSTVEQLWRNGNHREILEHLRLRAQPSLQLPINCGGDSDDLFTSSLNEIASQSLKPWNKAETEGNRAFLMREGALDIVFEIYALLLQLPWEDRGKLLQNMESSCLFFLWNLSETLQIRQLVVRKGGFNMMLKSLMRYSEEEFLSKYTQDSIFHYATGCLSNYCELECCRLVIIEKDNISVLQRLLQFAFHSSSEDITNIVTYMLIANLFFRISQSQKIHLSLITPTLNLLEPLINFFDLRIPTIHKEARAIRYVLGLTYARLILFSFEKIEEYLLKKMSNCMKDLLIQVKPNVVQELEKKYEYNWLTMFPFLEAAYTYEVEKLKVSNTHLKKSLPYETFLEENYGTSTCSSDSKALSLSLAVALFALMVEVARPINVDLLTKQDLLDYIVMLHWGMDDGWHNQCKWVQERVSKTEKLPIPRLSSIAKAKLARTNRHHGLASQLEIII